MSLYRWSIGIPFVNRPDLLRRAIASVPEPYREHVFVMDSSPDGLGAEELFVSVLRPTVPLSLTQTMNWLAKRSQENNEDFFCYMHSDAEAEPGTVEALLERVGELIASRARWGVVFTNYDTLAAYNSAAVKEVNGWDTVIQTYFCDNDFHRRVVLAGYELIETKLPVRHNEGGSRTIHSDPMKRRLHDITYPLFESYYEKKWGGRPGEEVFLKPFNWATGSELEEWGG